MIKNSSKILVCSSKKIQEGKYDVFISDLTEQELENAPEKVRNLLDEIEYQQIIVTSECEGFREEYLKDFQKIRGYNSINIKNGYKHLNRNNLTSLQLFTIHSINQRINFPLQSGYLV